MEQEGEDKFLYLYREKPLGHRIYGIILYDIIYNKYHGF